MCCRVKLGEQTNQISENQFFFCLSTQESTTELLGAFATPTQMPHPRITTQHSIKMQGTDFFRLSIGQNQWQLATRRPKKPPQAETSPLNHTQRQHKRLGPSAPQAREPFMMQLMREAPINPQVSIGSTTNSDELMLPVIVCDTKDANIPSSTSAPKCIQQNQAASFTPVS